MASEQINTTDIDLLGMGVLVTRPAQQATGLCHLIQTQGGQPLPMPALVIDSVIDPTVAQDLLTQTWDLAIYTSINAVQFAAQLRVEQGCAKTAKVIAIGKATAAALTMLGCVPDFVPTRQDSEGLLALPVLAKPAGQRILLVRGEGGRAILRKTLIQRGALVAIAEVYRRGRPNINTENILAYWEHDVHAVTVTSGELLDNLLALLGVVGYPKLLATPLVVVSERLQLKALQLGFRHIIRATGADDSALLVALSQIRPQ